MIVHICMLSRVWLCKPTDCSPPGSSVHGIFQARILEWVAISHSNRSSGRRDLIRVFCISCIGRWVLYHHCHLGIPTWNSTTFLFNYCWYLRQRTSLVAQMVKCLSTITWETQVRSLGGEDLEKEMATHSSTLARKIPWTEEPGRLQFMVTKTITDKIFGGNIIKHLIKC